MNELKNIGPNLSRINKENPFEVPDKYFEDFSTRLSERIHAERNTYAPKRHVLAYRPYLAAAFILVVALLAGNYFLGNHRSIRADKSFHAEISQVVEQELYSISEETIMEVMEVNSVEKSSNSTVSPTDAIDYLMNEGLTEEELLNAL